MGGFLKRSWIIVGATMLAGALGARMAGGHGAVIRLGAEAVAAGDSLAIVGEGLGVRAEITLTLEGASGRARLATLRGDSHGRFETVVGIPVETPAGTHRVVAEGGGERATKDLLVTAAVGGQRMRESPAMVPEAPEASAEEMPLEHRRSLAMTAVAWALVGFLVILGAWLARRPIRSS